MKRVIIFALVASLAIVAMSGCNDESKPHFTRMNVTPACGVAPLLVDGYAIASGGDESGDPTGGNNNIEVTWDFNDGGTSFSSIAYHNFTEPGTYTVTVVGTDNSGNVTSMNQIVTVLPDTLEIRTSVKDHPDFAVTTTDTVKMDIWASACMVQADTPADYRKLEYEWTFDDGGTTHVLNGQNPIWMFTTPADYTIYTKVTLAALAVTRFDTMVVSVTAAP